VEEVPQSDIKRNNSLGILQGVFFICRVSKDALAYGILHSQVKQVFNIVTGTAVKS